MIEEQRLQDFLRELAILTEKYRIPYRKDADGLEIADVRFLDNPTEVSHGHFVEFMKPIPKD
jgi:hypothetical protein